MTDEMLAKMWQSNEDFRQRFLGRPAKLEEALNAFGEEIDELAVSAFAGSDWHTALEAAGVFYTLIGVCRSRGIDLEMFLDACQYVISKNDAKTLETHYINDSGKIQRKGRE